MQALFIAYGSNCELETQILLSGDLGSIKSDDLKDLQRDRGDIERMLKALIKSLENKPSNPRILGPFLATLLERNLMRKLLYDQRILFLFRRPAISTVMKRLTATFFEYAQKYISL